MRAAGAACPSLRIIVAGDPEEAQKALERSVRSDEAFSLIVSDLKMPRATGIELIAWLRGRGEFSTLPTILLSSSAEPRDVQSAYIAGANLYMTKPTGLKEYKALVEQVRQFCADPSAPVASPYIIPPPP